MAEPVLFSPCHDLTIREGDVARLLFVARDLSDDEDPTSFQRIISSVFLTAIANHLALPAAAAYADPSVLEKLKRGGVFPFWDNGVPPYTDIDD